MKLILKICSVFILTFNHVLAQDTTAGKQLQVTGFLETYYCYDFLKPVNHTRPSFFYSYNRHNELNVNLGYIKATLSDAKLRGNFALMAGTYAEYNLATEPAALKNIFEANAGFKLSRKHNLWIDAGIMPSHIGFESAIGKDCWNLTKSILADNSPYYEAGAKLGYTTPGEKLYLSILYLNGWQRIQRVPGNQTPSFGSQVTYKPKNAITINWSTYIGNEFADSTAKWRYFSNFFSKVQVTSRFGFIAGFDAGIQQTKKYSKEYYTWYSPVLIIQYKISERLKIAVRGEYYSDENGVIIKTNTTNVFKTSGYSLNFDYQPLPNLLLRLEGRGLNSVDKIFLAGTRPDNNNYFVTTSISLSF